MATLGLIPAKGGSTRLRKKNILKLGNKRLIKWAIDSAKKSGVIDDLIVSTESEEIASIARSLGAVVPFMRPEYLAKDPAGVVEVALHALDELALQGKVYEKLVIMLPTCPFRSFSDIQMAMELFDSENGKFLMSVSEYPHTPFAALGLSHNNTLSPYFPKYIDRKSQEMPVAYRANGAIHILDVESFKCARSYYEAPLLGYAMPWLRSIDIDTEDDLKYAEFLIKENYIDFE